MPIGGRLVCAALAVADTYEVAWVAVQRWRGVASHFNFATILDASLFLAGAAAITVTIIVALTALAFTRLRAVPSMAVAVCAGLLVLFGDPEGGGWMIGHGVGPARDGVTQGLTIFGAAGVMKLPPTISVEHAAKLLGVSRSAAYQAAASGQLPTLAFGRRLRVPTAPLFKMLGVSFEENR